MGNQIALAVLTRPGDQVILDAGAHIYHYEGGAPANLSGLWPTLIESEAGAPRWEDIESAIPPDNIHLPRPSLVCLENTHNRAGGAVLPLERVDQIAEGAAARGLKLHLDGARLWNASAATGIPPERWCRGVDTVSVCFSKGLGAPVGSCLAATAELIQEARRVRKRLGGGMRQVGILAAACLYALDHNLSKLGEDHAKAKAIAEGLEHRHMRCSTAPESNIVLIDIDGEIGAERVLMSLEEEGVLAVEFGAARIRLVTHLDLSMEDCQSAVAVLNGLSL
jgi:threonine aldolase